MLRRKAYQRLLDWKESIRDSSALPVEGARCVGKSTLVEECGRREYASCLVADFNEAPAEVISYFEDYRADLDALFLYLSACFRVNPVERDTLIVFDEVQMYPPARALISYLVADGRYDYIETGSLLSVRQNVEGIVLPSEEEPMALDRFKARFSSHIGTQYMLHPKQLCVEGERAYLSLFIRWLL